MTDYFTPIDLYCERLTPSFWAEPFNAISNISFVIAGIMALLIARKLHKLDINILILSILAILIGIGSFLFHTFANTWSSFADVIPIWSFIALFIVVAIIKKTGKSIFQVGKVASCIIAIILGIIWITSSGSASQTQASTDIFNGSMQYLPAFIAICFFAFMSWKKQSPVKNYAIGSAVIFSISLVARTLDLYLCADFPIGTHFIWHICNGSMVGLLLQGLIKDKWKE